MGRPSVFTPKVIDAICALIANGVPATTACKQVGVSSSAYIRKRRAYQDNPAECEDPIAKHLWEASEKAKAEHEAKLVLIVQRAAMNPDPKIGPEHAKWLLERRYSKRWSNKQRTEITGKNGAPLMQNIDVTQKTDEELQCIAAGMAVGTTGSS